MKEIIKLVKDKINIKGIKEKDINDINIGTYETINKVIDELEKNKNTEY